MLKTLCRPVSHAGSKHVLNLRGQVQVAYRPQLRILRNSNSQAHQEDRKLAHPPPRRPSGRDAGFWGLLQSLQGAHDDEIQSFAQMFSENDWGMDRNWPRIVRASDFSAAITLLHKMGLVSDDGLSISSKLPTWLVLYLVRFNVQTAEQAHAAANLSISHSSYAPSSWRPRVLINAVHALSNHASITPVHQLVDDFLLLPQAPTEMDFNQMIRAITQFPGSSPSRVIIVKLLNSMCARQLAISPGTYDALITDRFLTLELTKALVQQMVHEGFVPNARQLESYLRIFAEHGAIHESATYLDALRDLRLRALQVAPYSSNATISENPTISPLAEARMPPNTQYLSALKFNPTSAFDYLTKMLKLEHHNLAHRPAEDVPPDSPHSDNTLEQIDRADWTTLLSSVSQATQKYDTQRLMAFFRTVKSPNAATYLVTMRGLLRRGEIDMAADLFRELKDSSARIDPFALATGIKALGRAGSLREAFECMEACTDPSIVEHRPGPRGTILPPPSSAVDIGVVNSFMAAAHRASRPDLVFTMWDHQHILYKTWPNTFSLNVMLDGARKAWAYSDTLTGAFAHLKYHLTTLSPFRADPQDPQTREEVAESIRSLFNVKRLRVTGLWHGAPAWRHAREIFRAVLLNWPELRDVLSPLDDSLARKDGQDTGGPEDDTAPPSWSIIPPPGPFPALIPDDASFCAYIRLLGIAHRRDEIPLALAWMRALRIRPTRKTLSLAILLWADQSVGGLSGESGQWTDVRATRAELRRLMDWMRAWVGPSNVPTRDNIEFAMRFHEWTRPGKHWQ